MTVHVFMNSCIIPCEQQALYPLPDFSLFADIKQLLLRNGPRLCCGWRSAEPGGCKGMFSVPSPPRLWPWIEGSGAFPGEGISQPKAGLACCFAKAPPCLGMGWIEALVK